MMMEVCPACNLVLIQCHCSCRARLAEREKEIEVMREFLSGKTVFCTECERQAKELAEAKQINILNAESIANGRKTNERQAKEIEGLKEMLSKHFPLT